MNRLLQPSGERPAQSMPTARLSDTTTSNLMDSQWLTAITHGNAAARSRVLADFWRANTVDLASLHQAADARDFAQVELLAHRIKGAAMMLGAREFAEGCSLVALASREQNPPEVQRALLFLDRKYSELQAHIALLGSNPEPTELDMAVAGTPQPLLCSGLNFMVVDDHEFQLGVMVRVLQRLGANGVRSHSDSASALNAMTDLGTPLDIVILDMSMPDMDGMELMQALSLLPHSCSIILNSALGPSHLSSLLQIARRHPLRVLGAAAKPLTEASLTPLIRAYRAQPASFSASTGAS